MLVLTDIVTESGQATYRQERFERYLSKASGFLRSNFAPFSRSLDEDSLKSGITVTYDRAKALMIRAEVDHLRYLSLTVMLGFAFERDPLRAPIMSAAGAYTDQAELTRPLPLSSLLAEAEAYLTRTAPDLARPQEIVRSLAEQRKAPAQTPDSLTGYLRRNWPERMSCLSPGQVEAFLHLAGDIGRRFRLNACDTVSLALLFPYFGSFMADNPFLPWAKAALTRPETEPAGPMPELGQGVLSYVRAITTETS